MKMTDDEVFAVLDRTERLIDCSGAFGLSEYQCEQRTVDARRKLREVRDYLSARLAADQQKGGGEVVALNLADHLRRQAAWSERTFGPGSRAKGVVDHIRKELLEIEADPGDLAEWIDVAILAFDGAWRSGATPEQIVAAMVGKQTRNEGRVWPDWRTADPDKAIEHDRSRDAPQPSIPAPAQQDEGFDRVGDAATSLRLLAATIRKCGTCAPAALELVAARLEALATAQQDGKASGGNECPNGIRHLYPCCCKDQQP